ALARARPDRALQAEARGRTFGRRRRARSRRGGDRGGGRRGDRVRRARHAGAHRGPHPLRLQRGVMTLASETPTITYREALREAIRQALIDDPRVFLMGEDVGRYGGCFGVSKGLLDEFGPERVRDTPLSES